MPQSGRPARRAVSRPVCAHEKNPALSVDRKLFGTSTIGSHPVRSAPTVAPHDPPRSADACRSAIGRTILKYLKARLCEADFEAGRLHDLVALLERVLACEPLWEVYRADCAYLSDFAVAYRYPGESSSREQSRDAVKRCRRFRLVARQSLRVREDPDPRTGDS